MTAELWDLRLADLFTFLAVHRCSSISGAARELRVTPSQVSKAVTRLEHRLQASLLTRSARGITLTETGHRLLPPLDDLAVRLRGLRSAEPPRPQLTVAAPSWVLAAFLPAVATALPDMRLRGIEMPPPLIRAFATENLFDVTFVGDPARLPPSWVGSRIGDVRIALFATRALAKRLGPAPVSVDSLRAHAFVTPIYSRDGQFVPVNDDCPLPRGERKLGHEAQTIALALDLAARSEQLVFGPVIAARGHLDRKELVEVRVAGWEVREPSFAVCRADAMSARVQRAIVAAVRDALARLQ